MQQRHALLHDISNTVAAEMVVYQMALLGRHVTCSRPCIALLMCSPARFRQDMAGLFQTVSAHFKWSFFFTYHIQSCNTRLWLMIKHFQNTFRSFYSGYHACICDACREVAGSTTPYDTPNLFLPLGLLCKTRKCLWNTFNNKYKPTLVGQRIMTHMHAPLVRSMERVPSIANLTSCSRSKTPVATTTYCSEWCTAVTQSV